MKADASAANDYEGALAVYKDVVSFIEAGRSQWADEPTSNRGAVFELTFLLGVERCYLDCLSGVRITSSKFQMDLTRALGIGGETVIACCSRQSGIPLTNQSVGGEDATAGC